jgi:hypothetical protein
VITADDVAIHEKFSVSEPKMCSLCRAQRRLMFRNERTFYKRLCDKCRKDVVSMYSPNKPYPVWCHDCWFSDDWDPLEYGREYDPSRNFFDQWKELTLAVPKVALIYVRSVNSEYQNIAADSKNCYMIIESSNNENCIHGYWLQVCKDCVDVSFSHQVELSYESDDCYNSNKLLYSKGCHDCLESAFLYDCRGCANCFGCVNLRNKQYYIWNKLVSKEEYEKFIKSVRLDTWSGVQAMRKKFEEFILTQPRKYAEIVNAPNSTGNYMKDVKNCKACFHAYDAEDSAYGVHVWRGAKNMVDCDTAGREAELGYNCTNVSQGAYMQIGTTMCWGSTYTEYSSQCHGCNNVFGSDGLRKKNYCILNKQYPKAEYEMLRERIVHQMRNDGEYGEFFPAQTSFFGYNEACVNEQFPITKEEVVSKGYKWEDYPRGTFDKETVSWDKVPDSINDVGSLNATKEIFSCSECEKNYRIIPLEFQFYKKLKIPLPRLCPDCRHTRRFQARGPNRLWTRQCTCDYNVYNNSVEHPHHPEDRCPNEFETSYAPDRKEIVYCESCYNAEVV